jgi:CYTH domain-containing protein
VSGARPLEIERVWVLGRRPEIPAEVLGRAERWEIEQGYLPLDAADLKASGFPEGRIRRIRTGDGRTMCRHTTKRGAGIVREEVETPIDDATFERLWPSTAGRRIAKRRLRLPIGGLIWELDDFRDIDLVMLEVELPTADASFAMPSWLADCVREEVSLDPRWRNAALAIHGVPTTRIDERGQAGIASEIS